MYEGGGGSADRTHLTRRRFAPIYSSAAFARWTASTPQLAVVTCPQERGCAKTVVQHGVFCTFSPPLALAFQPPEPEPRGRRGAGRHNLGNKIRRPLFNTQAVHSGCSLQGDSSDTCAITIANANDRSAGTVTLRHSPPVPPPMLCDNTCLRHFGNC